MGMILELPIAMLACGRVGELGDTTTPRDAPVVEDLKHKADAALDEWERELLVRH
jgi:hypothetical protein